MLDWAPISSSSLSPLTCRGLWSGSDHTQTSWFHTDAVPYLCRGHFLPVPLALSVTAPLSPTLSVQLSFLIKINPTFFPMRRQCRFRDKSETSTIQVPLIVGQSHLGTCSDNNSDRRETGAPRFSKKQRLQLLCGAAEPSKSPEPEAGVFHPLSPEQTCSGASVTELWLKLDSWSWTTRG